MTCYKVAKSGCQIKWDNFRKRHPCIYSLYNIGLDVTSNCDNNSGEFYSLTYWITAANCCIRGGNFVVSFMRDGSPHAPYGPVLSPPEMLN